VAEARVSQVVFETAIAQQPTAKVSQVVFETAILNNPNARVSQVIWETAVLPAKTPVPGVRFFPSISGGMGCTPQCVQVCPPAASAEFVEGEGRGGDPAIALALMALVVLLEDGLT
jgi:hypothetical protein